MDFNGKAAIVTGAGQGIGLEICRRLVEFGANVVLNDIDAQLATDAVKGLESLEGKCISFDKAVSEFGQLNIVIANAGITLFGDFLTYPKESFSNVMETNLGGSFFLTQAAANQMKKQGGGGTILLMSSVTGHQAHKNLAAYAMSKAALEMMAKNLVLELSPLKININTIAPDHRWGLDVRKPIAILKQF